MICGALLCAPTYAAPRDRITRPIDRRETTPLQGRVHRLAQPQFDQGTADPAFALDRMVLLTKQSPDQQSALAQLLADQQNPASPQFHKWLTPEEFGDRFGLNAADHSKVVAWLQSEGFTVLESSRARNWVAFTGTTARVRRALHTDIHRYRVDGKLHFANSTAPEIPSALAQVVGGFKGLHDFRLQPAARILQPDFNVGNSHYLVPEDFSTIYDVAPLKAAGIDGTGVTIGIVGATQLQLTDIRSFRSKYGLPAADPKSVLAGSDPGTDFNALAEADLDIQWSGALAPKAAIIYYYAANVDDAILAAINANAVQIVSISFGGSELDFSALDSQYVFQQANAQGITVLAATGDQGAANFPDNGNNATHGAQVSNPASYPEVTAVGGTEFSEGTGTYWDTKNSAAFGSALSYIPEIAWSLGGGGASTLFTKPAWQGGAGVPSDNARDLPDMSFSASTHDGYYVNFLGFLQPFGGTSASTPAMAGVTALLNHYLMTNGVLAKPGLGNINPQLYRLAQSAPTVFHDITGGSNIVTCQQGSAACSTGKVGYAAGPGYDMATGLGTLDVNAFVTQWSNATNAVTVTLTSDPVKLTLNDSFQLTAVVTPVSGSGVPTGRVDFINNAGITLASANLDASSGQATASVTLMGWQMGTITTFNVSAQYRGDTAFSGGGATIKVQITAPTGVSSIIPLAPTSVTGTPDASGVFWQFDMILREAGGVSALLTGFSIDGQAQPVDQYFSSPNIPARGSLTSKFIVFRNLAAPVVRTFGFSGVDAAGQTWSRQISVTFMPPQDVQTVLLTAVPLTMPQDLSAPTGCQWSQQLILNENSGFNETIVGLSLGNVSLSDQIVKIFGSTRLAAYRSLQGTICWPVAAAGTSNYLEVDFSSGLTQTLTVSFAGPEANPGQVTTSAPSVTLTSATPQAQGTLGISVADGQSWTASIYPQNRSTGWLKLSQASGTGPATVTLEADGTGYQNAVYLATLLIQGPNVAPAVITVPVMFVYGDSSTVSISGLTNAASGQPVAAPGMIATLRGTGLASLTFKPATAASFSQNGISLTVNGIPAAFKNVSPTQIDFQIPYETGIGPAVVGVNNNGQIGGFIFQVAQAAPGIFADANGNLAPTSTVQAGKNLTLTMTGDGYAGISDGAAPTSSSLATKPALPFTVTIGGVPVFVNTYGIAAGAVGVTTVNMTVPTSVPAGPQPVVVTVNGVASPPVTVNVN